MRISVRVWTPSAGTPILLKTEITGEGIYCETIQYTTQEGWETLEFNFGNELPGGPELEVNYPYDLLVIFFGFGDEGVEGSFLCIRVAHQLQCAQSLEA